MSEDEYKSWPADVSCGIHADIYYGRYSFWTGDRSVQIGREPTREQLDKIAHDLDSSSALGDAEQEGGNRKYSARADVHMTGDLSNSISSLPSRALKLEEVHDLGETDRFEAIYADDKMKELIDPHEIILVYNLVLITGERVSAAVFIEEDETWYRVYSEPRSEAVLMDAYEVVREVRGMDDLFDRHELTVEEAVFAADRPTGEETSGYEDGDTFPCPVCGDEHEVKFHEEEYAKDIEGVDPSYLYVECPDTRRNELTIENQASTPSR